MQTVLAPSPVAFWLLLPFATGMANIAGKETTVARIFMIHARGTHSRMPLGAARQAAQKWEYVGRK